MHSIPLHAAAVAAAVGNVDTTVCYSQQESPVPLLNVQTANLYRKPARVNVHFGTVFSVYVEVVPFIKA